MYKQFAMIVVYWFGILIMLLNFLAVTFQGPRFESDNFMRMCIGCTCLNHVVFIDSSNT